MPAGNLVAAMSKDGQAVEVLTGGLFIREFSKDSERIAWGVMLCCGIYICTYVHAVH